MKTYHLQPTRLYVVEVSLDTEKTEIFNLGRSKINVLGEVTKDSISFNVDPYLEWHEKDITESKWFDYMDVDNSYTDSSWESFHTLLEANGIPFKSISSKNKLLIFEEL